MDGSRRSRPRILLLIMPLVGWCCLVPAVGTDFVWDGEGVGSGDGSEDWTNPTMWDQGSGYPDGSGDNATLADPSPTAECTFDRTTATTLGDLTVTGSSPTKMTLHVRDAPLTLSSLNLNDYSVLDLDQDLTLASSSDTTISGSVWIDVANSKVLSMQYLRVDDTIGTLHISGLGEAKAHAICADAAFDAARREFRLASGDLIVSGDGPLICRFASSTTNSDHRAKLWINSGAEIRIDTIESGLCDCDMVFAGGPSQDKRVELDLDGDLDIQCGSCVTSMTGYISIDLDGAVFKAGNLLIAGRVSLSSVNGESLTSRQNICSTAPEGCSNCNENCANCPETCP